MPAGGSLRPASHETVEQRLHYVKQDGQAVFKFAVRKTEEISRLILQRNGLTRRRRRPVRVAPGQPPHHHRPPPTGSGSTDEKVIINLERYGNTTAATIPLALTDAMCAGAPEEGRPRAARLGRRRVHGRVGALALGLLNLTN